MKFQLIAEQWSHVAKTYSTNFMAEIPHLFADIAASNIIQHADGKPINFLDVAAGKGAFTENLLRQLSASQLEISSITATDFSVGMIDGAREIIEALAVSQPIKKSFLVMDAQELSFDNNTFSHVGCMFGTMFFPDRHKGLNEMYRVLEPGGLVVIGTWHHMDTVDIVVDFGRFVGLPYLAENKAAMAEVVAAGSDRVVLAAELTAAGFSDVAVHVHKRTLYLPNTIETYNNVIGGAAKRPDSTEAETVELYARWVEFLDTAAGRDRWVSAEGGQLMINFIANIATGKKLQ